MALDTSTARQNFINGLLTDDIRNKNVMSAFVDRSLESALQNALSVPIPTLELGTSSTVSKTRGGDWDDETGNTATQKLLVADTQVRGYGRIDVLDTIEHTFDSVGPTIASMRHDMETDINSTVVAAMKNAPSQAMTDALDKNKIVTVEYGDATNGIVFNTGKAEGDANSFVADALEDYRTWTVRHSLWDGEVIVGQGIPSQHVMFLPFEAFRLFEADMTSKEGVYTGWEPLAANLRTGGVLSDVNFQGFYKNISIVTVPDIPAPADATSGWDAYIFSRPAFTWGMRPIRSYESGPNVNAGEFYRYRASTEMGVAPFNPYRLMRVRIASGGALA